MKTCIVPSMPCSLFCSWAQVLGIQSTLTLRRSAVSRNDDSVIFLVFNDNGHHLLHSLSDGRAQHFLVMVISTVGFLCLYEVRNFSGCLHFRLAVFPRDFSLLNFDLYFRLGPMISFETRASMQLIFAADQILFLQNLSFSI